MSTLKQIVMRESCFQPGSTLCPGCMEGVAFHDIGQITDNGIKTIYTMGTFCGEVSTLKWPDVVAWGRGAEEPASFAKSFSILHNVFESAPTVAEAIRDTADSLTELGALSEPVQVMSNSGDGGALSIGLRSLLHTVQRRARVTLVILINEIFANTGFQYAPTATPHAETATTPTGAWLAGNTEEPLNHLGLVVMAGAKYVAQVSPAFPNDFLRAMETALATTDGTSVIFVPSPCITGWKYEEGETEALAKLAARCGLLPCFFKRAGEKGQVKHVSPAPDALEKYLSLQRRFHHLVRPGPKVVPGAEPAIERIRAWAKRNVAQLEALAAWAAS